MQHRLTLCGTLRPAATLPGFCATAPQVQAFEDLQNDVHNPFARSELRQIASVNAASGRVGHSNCTESLGRVLNLPNCERTLIWILYGSRSPGN
jgi:hypothetical protein